VSLSKTHQDPGGAVEKRSRAASKPVNMAMIWTKLSGAAFLEKAVHFFPSTGFALRRAGSHHAANSLPFPRALSAGKIAASDISRRVPRDKPISWVRLMNDAALFLATGMSGSDDRARSGVPGAAPITAPPAAPLARLWSFCCFCVCVC
jgi:hypothetical protein